MAPHRHVMPKTYTAGGRSSTAAGPNPRPGSGPQSWRERFGALRNLPPFLKLVWQTSPALTLALVALRVVRALLPVASLYVGKLIIDEVVGIAGSASATDTLTQWLASGLVDRIALLLAVEFGLAVLSDVLGRTVSLLDSLLSEQFSNATSLRLMEHAATLDLEDFEDSELQDRLDRARRQTIGRNTLLGQVFGQAQDIITIVSFGATLVVYAPWLIALLALALVPAFLGEAHFNAQSYSLNYLRAPERRELDYVRQTGASVETAKEVKIFGLNGFLIDRYRRLAAELLRGQSRARDPARGLGQRAHRHRHRRLLRRLRLHRLADAARRVQHRRPHLPRRLVPAAAQPARGAADRLLVGRGPGALPRRPVLVLRDPGRRSCHRRTRGRSRTRSAKGSASRTWASAIRAPSAGRCGT